MTETNPSLKETGKHNNEGGIIIDLETFQKDFQLGEDFSLLLFIVSSFAFSASLFYSKCMFTFENLNPMEAIYVNSLVLFTITLFILMIYINNWFKPFRRKTHTVMNKFHFPNSSAENRQVHTKDELNNYESPKSLKYNDISISESSASKYFLAHNGNEIKEEDESVDHIIENDHIMHYLKVQPVYRDNLFASCLFSLVGVMLITMGLNHHLLSFTTLCISLISPVMSTIAFKSKIGLKWSLKKLGAETVILSYEVGYLAAAVMGMVLVSNL